MPRVKIVGGTGGNGTFSDTFQRANTTEGAGPNWAVNRQASAVDVCFFKINNNLLRWVGVAGSGNSINLLYCLAGGGIFGGTGAVAAGASPLQAPSHFSQATISADNSVGGSLTRVGPSVAMNGTFSLGSGYFIENLPELLSFNISRFVNGTFTNIVDHSATQQYSTVVGLTLKLSWELTSASAVTIRSYVNGTLIDTVQDTNAARSVNGGPGMLGEFASITPRFCDYSAYRCGPGI